MALKIKNNVENKLLNSRSFFLSKNLVRWFGIAPAFIVMGVFFIYPVLKLISRSVFDPHFTLEHYSHIFSEPVYLYIIGITFKISIIVTILALLLGYPLAYAMYRTTARFRIVILSFILLPFWTSLLVRTFAFMILLQREGLLNQILLSLNLINEPIPLVYNLNGVIIGMTYMLLPYMVLPLYSVMDRIDPSLEKIARGLGASKIRAFASTILPLSTTGIFAGASLVFLLSLGFFVTPALLGGRKEQMLSIIIEQQVNKILDWGFAASLSTVLLLSVFVFAVILGAINWLLVRRFKILKVSI